MRSHRHWLPALLLFVVALAAPCLAQTSPGPATLENLLNSAEFTDTPPAMDQETSGSGSRRPPGTVARPKDGVPHPDLDKAWAYYETAVGRSSEVIREWISEQFDAAAATGDLDNAERWQDALEKFEKFGEVPTAGDSKAVVSRVLADYKNAKDDLCAAYESVVASLTKEKKIAEARAVRDESKAIVTSTPHQGNGRRGSPPNLASEPQAMFLSDLQEQDVRITAGWEWRFGKNGQLGNPEAPRRIVVAGANAKKGLSTQPGAYGESVVTYVVPAGFHRIQGMAAMDDSAVGQAPIVFEICDGGNILWRSKQLSKPGESEAFSIRLNEAKNITLRARCLGKPFGRHAVWVDPKFTKD